MKLSGIQGNMLSYWPAPIFGRILPLVKCFPLHCSFNVVIHALHFSFHRVSYRERPITMLFWTPPLKMCCNSPSNCVSFHFRSNSHAIIFKTLIPKAFLFLIWNLCLHLYHVFECFAFLAGFFFNNYFYIIFHQVYVLFYKDMQCILYISHTFKLSTLKVHIYFTTVYFVLIKVK